ncbi:hypothetical protein chiPu_0019878 [Chiloscyllium punctatum]|uniref:Uncharacterized protein n=1 Tax=Chiloscyllium punctatum TaxID=137246 RepID=A0A401RTE5_CHIPU|nr:hypothetical protein [Chiloscyllium punctatum]
MSINYRPSLQHMAHNFECSDVSRQNVNQILSVILNDTTMVVIVTLRYKPLEERILMFTYRGRHTGTFPPMTEAFALYPVHVLCVRKLLQRKMALSDTSPDNVYRCGEPRYEMDTELK